MHSHDDNRAVRAVLNGDTNRFRELVERYQGAIFSLLLRTARSRNEAADLAQEVFVKAFENLHTYDNGRAFFPWLYAIGINTARDWLRKCARREVCEIDEEMPAPGRDETGESAILALDSRAVKQALECLPLGQREAIVLRYSNELTMKEIAEVLGISESGVKMRIQRGLEAMRRMLGEKGNEP